MTKLVKTISFKLIPTNEQVQIIEDSFNEFSKAVNFYLKKIKLIRDSFVGLPEEEQIKARCECCQN